MVRFGIIAFALVLRALSSACSQAGQEAAQPAEEMASTAANTPQYDFKAMLTRTDEVEVCTVWSMEDVAILHARDILPEDLARSQCECLSEGTRYQIKKIGVTDPILENALVQITQNRELITVLRTPKKEFDAIDAFLTYANNEMEHELGFDGDQMRVAMEATTAAIKKYERDPYALIDEVPSCREFFDWNMRYFPEWDPDTGREGFDSVLAERARNNNNAAKTSSVLRGTINP